MGGVVPILHSVTKKDGRRERSCARSPRRGAGAAPSHGLLDPLGLRHGLPNPPHPGCALPSLDPPMVLSAVGNTHRVDRNNARGGVFLNGINSLGKIFQNHADFSFECFPPSEHPSRRGHRPVARPLRAGHSEPFRRRSPQVTPRLICTEWGCRRRPSLS